MLKNYFGACDKSGTLGLFCLSPNVLFVPVKDPGRAGTSAGQVGQSHCRDQLDQLRAE